MLTEPRRLAALLEQACFGEADRSDGIAWHGPSVRRVLEGVSAAAASVRSGQSHSIWEITLHIAFWDEVCRRRLSGERIDITTGDPGDWPDCPEATEANWQATRDRLERAERELIDTVRHLEPGDLERFPIVRSTAIVVLLPPGGRDGTVLDGSTDTHLGGL